MGVRNDVNRLMNSFDCFAFPSLYEGLPFTLVEAQCNGVPIVYSDRVTDEMLINNNVKIIPLEYSDKEWAETILATCKLGRDSGGKTNIVSNGFDLQSETKELEAFYLSTIRNNGND